MYEILLYVPKKKIILNTRDFWKDFKENTGIMAKIQDMSFKNH